MNPKFFERPILNSPYAAPSRHWELDERGQPTHRVVESRRQVRFLSPIPAPKTRRPPHFHARYGGEEAQFAVATGERLAGRLPPRVQGLVSEWLEMHREALRDNWTKAREGRPLDRIDGLV